MIRVIWLDGFLIEEMIIPAYVLDCRDCFGTMTFIPDTVQGRFAELL
jgi:hypothetical protein